MPGHGIPQVRAEIALSTDPLTRPGTWTDFASQGVYIRDLKTVRGAPIRLPGVETGTAVVVFDDPARVLDDTNAASPWAGQYGPRRRVRLYVDPANSTERLVYTGFIERTVRSWSRSMSVSTVTLADLFSVIAGATLPPSVLDVEIRASLPLGYWPMTETAGTYADDAAGSIDGTYLRPITGTAQAALYDKRGNVICKRRDKNDQVAQRMLAVMPSGLTAASMVMHYKWQPGKIDTDNLAVLMLNNNGTGNVAVELRPVGDGTHKLRLLVYDSAAASTVYVDTTAAFSALDGVSHAVGFSIDGAETPVVYFDGVARATTLGPSSPAWSTVNTAAVLAGATEARVGWGTSFYSAFTSMDPNTAAVGHGALWDRVLTGTEFTTLYNAAANPWDDDLTSTRLGRILDLIGVAAGDRDIAVGTQRCGPTFLAGENALGYIRKIATTEGAGVFVTPDGKVRLRARTPDDPAPVLIVSDDPVGDGGVPYSGAMTVETSLDRIINVADVTREGANPIRTVDQSSVDRYGERNPASLNTLDPRPYLARATGARIVGAYAAPRPAFEEFTVPGRDGYVTAAAVLDTEIGDAVRLIVRPPGGGAALNQLSLLERIEHHLDGSMDWATKFNAIKHVNFPTPVPPVVPTFVAATSATQTTAAEGHVVNKPAGVAVGDVLVALLMLQANSPIVVPAGWTAIDASVVNGSVTLYRRTVDGTEGSTFTWLTNSPGQTESALAVIAIRGAQPTPDQHEFQYNNNSSASTAPTITPTAEGSLLIYASAAVNPASTTYAFSTPTGMTARVTAAGSTSPGAYFATEALLDPDATGTRTSTLTGGSDYDNYGFLLNFAAP